MLWPHANVNPHYMQRVRLLAHQGIPMYNMLLASPHA